MESTSRGISRIPRPRRTRLLEVKLRKVITDGKNPTRFDWETFTMPADRNTCYKRAKSDGPMEKVGDSVMGNCTPD